MMKNFYLGTMNGELGSSVTQKSFFEGSIKTLDNMGFAIKNRLDISKL